MGRAAAGALLFVLAGPLLETVAGPLALTGFHRGAAPPHALWPLGVVLILAGTAVLVDTYRRFVAEGRGTPSPAAPTQRMVATGVYRHVRHPQYVATATVLVGEALALQQTILLIAAAVYLTALAALVRTVEEPRLRARFGSDYDAYRAGVPGWLPRPPRRR